MSWKACEQKRQLESATQALEDQKRELEKEKTHRLWQSVRKLSTDLEESMKASQRRMEKIENSELFGPDIKMTPEFRELKQIAQELWEHDRTILRHPAIQSISSRPSDSEVCGLLIGCQLRVTGANWHSSLYTFVHTLCYFDLYPPPLPQRTSALPRVHSALF